MKKLLLSTLLICLIPTTAFADTFLGLYAGAGGWNIDYDGEVKLLGPEINIQDEFGIDKSTDGFFFVAFEHFVPLVPNFKVQYTQASTTGNSTLEDSILFSDITFASGEEIDSTIELNNADLIAYYEFLDNWLTFDIGLNLKVFDGSIVVRSLNSSVTHDFTVPVPMIYTKVQADIPFTGFYFGGEGSGIGTGRTKVLDLKAYAGYESEIGFGCELGWRKISLNVEDVDDLMVDVSAQGPFASVNFHF